MQSPSAIIFTSPLLQVGRFCCPTTHPHFHDTGPIVSGHLIVFPRTNVYIRHPGLPPIITTPNLVMFYNLQQTYRRDELSAEGDRCDWFAFAPTVLLNALQGYDPQALEQPEQPFRFTHVLGTPPIYLRQRQVVEYIRHTAKPDILYIEETMLLTLTMLLAQVYRYRSPQTRRPRPATHRQQLAIVHTIQTELACHFQDKLCLSELAAKVYLSPYELCRVFRAHTGCTIHQYLNQLRLSTALETVLTPGADLTELALNLGYNSHSHFTSAFRKAFGIPPTMLRGRPQLATNLRKNLIV